MFMNRLEVRNFKCFKEADLRLGKITVLTGANSSGKSSLLYSLLGAIQTERFPLNYSPNGNYVDMGDFAEISFMRERDHEVGIKLHLTDDLSNPIALAASYYRNTYNGMPRLQALTFESPGLSAEVSKKDQYTVRYDFRPENDPAYEAFKTDVFRSLISSLEQIVEDAHEEAGRNKQGKRKGVRSSSFSGWDTEPPRQGSFKITKPLDLTNPAATRAHYAVQTRLMEMTSLLSNLDRRFNYISSFRLAPQRTYYQVSKGVWKVGRLGENTVDQVSEWESARSDKLRQLKDHLAELQLLTDIKTVRMRSGRFDVLVKPHRQGISASLVDVGFGISQFLPILVADVQLGRGSTLAVSQPEIHLHPSVQADLASYFAGRCDDEDKRYIIETHSEYLLNRLRLLIVQERLDPEDVSIVYLRNSSAGAQLFAIEFTKTGEILGAPEDFFKTYMLDVMSIAMEA
jgi:predicted ATPase